MRCYQLTIGREVDISTLQFASAKSTIGFEGDRHKRTVLTIPQKTSAKLMAKWKAI